MPVPACASACVFTLDRVPILAWVDTDVTRAQQEGADVAAADSLSGDGEGDWEEDQEGQEEYVEEGEELLSLTGGTCCGAVLC